IRNAMYDLFAVFDYCDPSVHLEQRPASAVATQALLLLNSPFVLQQSAALAAGARAAVSDDSATGDAARIAWIWAQAFQRAPSASELQAAQRWLSTARAALPGPGSAAIADAAEAAAWQGLCQTVFASNEFVYVD